MLKMDKAIHISNEEKREAKQFFFNSTGFPGVIGAVDGTQIQIIRSSENEHLFFNMKHYPSFKCNDCKSKLKC